MDSKVVKKIREYFTMAGDVAIEENAVPTAIVMSLPTGTLIIGGPGAPRKVTRQRLSDAEAVLFSALMKLDDRFGVMLYYYQGKELILPDEIYH